MVTGEPRFSVLRRKGPRGLGRSYVDGYRHAMERGYARLVQMDADFSHDPSRLPDILAAARAADVVVGSRYCPGGGIGNWPPLFYAVQGVWMLIFPARPASPWGRPTLRYSWGR